MTTFSNFDEFKEAVKAHEPIIEPQQLYAKIKKSSKYAGQIALAKRDGAYPFPVMIQDFEYSVKGGPGGQYRLADVSLFVKVGKKFIKIKG